MLLCVFGCASDTDSATFNVSVEALRGSATYVVADVNNGTPISEAVGVHPLGSDSVTIIDAVDPFIRIYGEEGEIKSEYGSRGEGPAELGTPSPGAVIGDTLVLFDRALGRIVHLRLTPYGELGRFDIPSGLATLFHGCGGLSAVIQLVRPERTPSQEAGDVQNYTLAFYRSGEWKLASGEWPAVDFVPSPNGFVAAARDGQVAIYNYFHSKIEVIGCRSGVIEHEVPVPYPDSWRIPPRPLGIGWVDDRVVALYTGAPRVLRDSTYFVMWRPEEAHASVHAVPGRLQLHAVTPDAAWFVDNNVVPVPFRVSLRAFRDLLGDR